MSNIKLSMAYKVTLPTVQGISTRTLSCSSLLRNKEFFSITYEVGNDGEKHTVLAKDGDNLLDIVINNDVDIDGFGACEGTLACSTCHVVFTDEVRFLLKAVDNVFILLCQDFAKLDDEATDEELDMLDLAYGLTDTSRLGCQVGIHHYYFCQEPW